MITKKQQEFHLEWLADRTSGERIVMRDADLRGANLYEAALYEADLSGANLSRANLSRADLSGTNLHSANLSGADLSGADLSRADLSHTKGVFYACIDKRGFTLVIWRHPTEVGRRLWVNAGCHSFPTQEAIKHWGGSEYRDTKQGKRYVVAIEFLVTTVGDLL